MSNFEKISSKWWGMLIISSLPFLVILAPILFFGQIYANSDIVSDTYPNHAYFDYSLKTGQSIIWNDDVFSGFPVAISSMIVLSPLYLLFIYALPYLIAIKIYILFSLTLALYFTWLLLKKFGLPSAVGFFGGLVYVFSQWHLIHDLAISNALIFLPLLFLIVFQLYKKNSITFFIIGVLLIGWAWFSVNITWLIMIFSAATLFVIFLAFFDKKKWQLPPRFFLMVFLGTLIGLIIIIPFLDYASLSSRSEGLSYQEVAVGAFNIGDLFRFILPNFKTAIFNFASSPTQIYIGILPLFFLIYAFKHRSNKLVLFFFGTLLLSILMAIKYSPLFWVFSKLPIFNALRGPDRWMFIGSFSMAILSSFGLYYFIEEKKENYRYLIIKILKWIGISLLVAFTIISLFVFFYKEKIISFVYNYFDINLYHQTSKLPLEHYHKVINNYFSEAYELINIFSYKVFLPLFFILISYLIMNYYFKNNSLIKSHFIPIVLIVSFFNFIFVFMFAQPTIPQDLIKKQPKSVEFIKKNIEELKPQESTRIFSFMPGFTEYTKLTVPFQPSVKDSFIFQAEILAPNFNLYYGLSSVDFYGNLMSRRMSRILAAVGSDRATYGNKISDLSITPDQKAKILGERKQLLDLIGARYIISVIPLDENIFKQVYQYEIDPYRIKINIYENKDARPLYYLAELNIKTIEEDEQKAFDLLLNESWESRKIFIECNQCPDVLRVNGRGVLSLKERKNNLLHLNFSSESPQWLVFSENNLPGWRAYIDGQNAETYTVNSVYMGILVPKGEHDILFKYNYPFLWLKN